MSESVIVVDGGSGADGWDGATFENGVPRTTS